MRPSAVLVHNEFCRCSGGALPADNGHDRLVGYLVSMTTLEKRDLPPLRVGDQKAISPRVQRRKMEKGGC
jgi:hypothetical protein